MFTLFSQMRETFSNGRNKSTRNCACSRRNWSTQSTHTYKGGGLSPHCMASAGSRHICYEIKKTILIKVNVLYQIHFQTRITKQNIMISYFCRIYLYSLHISTIRTRLPLTVYWCPRYSKK